MSTGLWVALIGIIVSYIGWSAMQGELGAGVLGFGLAHIVLGLLDAAFNRAAVHNNARNEAHNERNE